MEKYAMTTIENNIEYLERRIARSKEDIADCLKSTGCIDAKYIANVATEINTCYEKIKGMCQMLAFMGYDTKYDENHHVVILWEKEIEK